MDHILAFEAQYERVLTQKRRIPYELRNERKLPLIMRDIL
jgi:hypothetical protein